MEQVDLPEPCKLERPTYAHRAHCRCTPHHLFQKAPSLRKTARERIRVSKAREGGPRLDLPLSEENQPSFLRTDGPVEVTLHEVHATDRGQGLRQGKWVVRLLGEPERLLGARDRLGKSPLIRKGQGEPRARSRGEKGGWKTTVRTLTCALRASRKEVDGLAVVTDGEVCLTGAVSGLELQRSIAKLVRNRQSTPADLHGLMMLTDDIPESRAYVGKHQPQAGAVAEAGRHAFDTLWRERVDP